MEDLYTSGEYLRSNPAWHARDSAWKAEQILRMMKKNAVLPVTLCEVGCGAGGILSQLHEELPATQLIGYEVSPQAFELCAKRRKDRLRFFLGDVLKTQERFDLLLCIDVFEHVPSYLDFLEKLRNHADRFIFHIPLDLSLLTILRPGRLLKSRYGVGHLHTFTYELALAVLHDTGYQKCDAIFTAGGMELEEDRRRARTMLANLPRRVVGTFSSRLSSQLFGGYSLLVLAK